MPVSSASRSSPYYCEDCILRSCLHRIYCLVLSIVFASFSVAPSIAQSGSQDNYRIQRGKSWASTSGVDPSAYQNNGSSSYNYNMISQGTGAGARPLVGGIEHRAYVAPGQLNSLNGKTDSSLLRGSADQLRSGVNDRGPLNGGLNDRNMPLGTGIMDRNSPLQANINDRGNPLSGNVNDRNLKTGIPFLDKQNLPPLPLNTKQTRLPGDISDVELNKLKQYDTVIVQDRSSSMGEHENYPQGYFPRWYWCLMQAMDLRRQTFRLPSWTFDLVLFSAKYDLYRNVTMQQLPSCFSRDGIWIGTHLGPPLQQIFDEYFQRRATGHARPLIVAVVTDGKPKDMNHLVDVLVNATQQMRNPSEIHVTILQVGTDDESYRKLDYLSHGLVGAGARFPIVSVMPFSQVTRLGLTRALVTAVETAPNRR